ncbi:MAG: addiction module protein [Planctomycetota bacterium]
MLDFNTVFDGARQLSAEDQLRLIDALWDVVPAEATPPLHDDWALELERRVAALQTDSTRTVPWTTIRDEALARIDHDKSY